MTAPRISRATYQMYVDAGTEQGTCGACGAKVELVTEATGEVFPVTHETAFLVRVRCPREPEPYARFARLMYPHVNTAIGVVLLPTT